MDFSKETASSISSKASQNVGPLGSDPYNHDSEKQDTKIMTLAPNEKAPKDPNIVDWDGENDLANPMNWSTARKVASLGLGALITLLSPLASTITAPASAEVMQTFHSTNETLAAFVTSVYLLGYTFGPLVIAPCSELYGRQVVYNVCNFIFLIFNIACAVAPSLNSLIVFRFFAGIGASCPLTIGSGSIADMVPLEKRGMAMALWILGPILGPTVGPLAGGYLAEAKGWRWIFWLLSIFSGFVFLLSLVFMPESYAYTILDRKTKRLRKETGNQNLRSALDTGKTSKEVLQRSIIRPLKMLCFSPMVFLLSLYLAIVYGFTYLMFTTFPRVFEGQYGFTNTNIGLTYLGIGVGSFIGLIICGLSSDRLVKYLTLRNGGTSKPEYRIPMMAIGAFVIPIGLFLYGWSAEKRVQYIVPIVGTAFLGGGLFFILMPIQTYLVDAFTVYAASATAASSVFRSVLGALLPLAGNSMYNALGIGWGTSLMGFIAAAFIPLPFVFWIYGERLRSGRFAKVQF